MSNHLTKLTLSDDGLTINGEHYTIFNGFMSKKYDKVHLRYNDLLAVEFVKYRSKKLMYSTLFLGGILIFVLDFADILPAPALTIITLIICIMGLLYLFSAEQFIELTTMRGTYRVASGKDTETKRIVENLQARIH